MAVTSVRCAECRECFRIEGPGAQPEAIVNWHPPLCRPCFGVYDFAAQKDKFFETVSRFRKRRRTRRRG